MAEKIPVNSYVKNVYINTILTKEDIETQFRVLVNDFSEYLVYGDGYYKFVILETTGRHKQLSIRCNMTTLVYSIVYDYKVLFDSVNGFAPFFSGKLVINQDNIGGNDSVNEFLKTIFSITPFERLKVGDKWFKDVADAIRERTNSVGKINAQEFASKIRQDGSPTLAKVLNATKNAQYLFSQYTGDNVDDLISANDTYNVVNASYMFERSNVKRIPNLNFASLQIADNMFYNSAIVEFDNTSTQLLESMTNMFKNCHFLTKVRIENGFYRKNDIETIFDDCENLHTIVLYKKRSGLNQQFRCRTLRTLVITGSYEAGGINDNTFNLCLPFINNTGAKIYVPSWAVEEAKADAPRYADIIFPVEDWGGE